MQTDIAGMDLVPPEQRQLVLRRIAVFEEYDNHCRTHGRSTAYTDLMAARLGIGRQQFYYLSSGWRAGRQPHRLLTRFPGRPVPIPVDRREAQRPYCLPAECTHVKVDWEERRAIARRLRQARRRAGYPTRQDANVRFGWNATDSRDHESSALIGPRALAAYAQAYGVTTGQLTGEVPMDLDPTIGQRIGDMLVRSRTTQMRLANAGGWAGPDSMLRYARRDYDPDVLPVNAAEKLVLALVGRGSPAITRDEIMVLCERHPQPSRKTLVEASVPRIAIPGDQPPRDPGHVPASRPAAATVSHIDLSLLRPADQLAMMTLYQSLLQNSSAPSRSGH